MANCVNYGCDETLGTYNESECGQDLVGGSNAALFLECNHQLTDPSDTAAVQAEIDAGRATLVTRASFSIEAASPVTSESIVPCEPSSVSTYNRTIIYKNPNVNATNVDFHKTIFKGRRFGGIIIYECGTVGSINGAQVTWIDAVVTFTGSRILPGVTTEKQRFEGVGSWISQVDADIYAAPAGIFD